MNRPRPSRRLARGARLAAAALATTASLTMVTGGAVAAPSSTRAADAALDRSLQQLVKMPGGPPGVISVVQRGGAAAVPHTAGVADLQTGAAPAALDQMRIASVAKAFSGAAALAVVRDGALSLRDTIGQRLPSLPAAWKDVTLAQALNHTSGLPDYTQSKSLVAAATAAPFDPPPPAQLVSYVADQPLEFKPGSRYRYSNTDNIVVGLMVQAATGRSYEDVLQAKVFGPLGLLATTLPRGVQIPAPFLHGYTLEPSGPPEDGSEAALAAGWSWASGGILSTPDALNRFIRAYASGATANKAGLAAQFRFVSGTSEPPGPGTNGAGLGIFRYQTRCGTVYGHTGNTPGGYTQFAAATRDGTRSATVSVNTVLTPKSDPARFPALRKAFELAVCAALAR
jgi:D-alanyl-D-alanine carboxypeptidase